MTLATILAALDTLEIPYTFDGWVALPKNHVFATWNNPVSEFTGADDYAMYTKRDITVALFYRDNKILSDFEVEKNLEQLIRECGEFKRSYDYDNDNKLYVASYSFKTNENMEE